MTESEWLAAADPTAMLSFLRDGGLLSERKARLFAVARCRLFRPDWNEQWWPIRDAVNAAEQFSDGLVPAEHLARFHRPREEFALEMRLLTRDPWGGSTVLLPSDLSGLLVQDVSSPDALAAAWGVLSEGLSSAFGGAWKEGVSKSRAECALLREVFGNPFRRAAVASSLLDWHGGIIVRMATAVYVERSLPGGELDPARLAVLADALEEAGVTDGEILRHCREPGAVHVRGCWLIDLLTSRR
jgi:hypothetical protein